MVTRTLVIHPAVSGKGKGERSLSSALEEAVGLAAAIDLEVVHAHIVRLQKITPATYIGKGKAAELAATIEADEITLAVIDGALTPVQQRNLEKAFGCKVIDRTALILEIFGARARTAEGKLQVELASLTYQKSRLVRSWTHLERQRGGFGFLGGPGESQIEIDRRLIAERIDKIKKQLANVTRTRALHRATRADVPYPLVALVGYTNAGKSTLFNRLTQSKVEARDMLFATLDPTIRECILPSGMKIMLSDTVGFISNLPTELIAAFRATLEEVLSADLLLHVRDISHADSDAQAKDVMKVLRHLFGKDHKLDQVMQVHNKIDLWEAAHHHAYPAENAAIGVSASSGEGCDALLARIDEELGSQLMQELHYTISHSQGRAGAWLYANAQILKKKDSDEFARFTVRITPANAARFTQEFAIKST